MNVGPYDMPDVGPLDMEPRTGRQRACWRPLWTKLGALMADQSVVDAVHEVVRAYREPRLDVLREAREVVRRSGGNAYVALKRLDKLIAEAST